MKKIAIACAVLLLPLISGAAYFKTDKNLSLPAGELIRDDVYLAGNSLSVDADVAGDLVGAAGDAFFRGRVDEDLLVVSGTVHVEGPVAKDLRAAAGTAVISAPIGEDLIIAATDIIISPKTVVSGDVVLLGGTIVFEGVSKRDLAIIGGNAIIRGSVSGNVNFVGDKLTVSKTAIIDGALSYRSKQTIVLENGAVVKNGVTRKSLPVKEMETWHSLGMLFGEGAFFRILISLISVLLLIWLLPKTAEAFSQSVTSRFGKVLLFGLATFLGLPLLALVLMFSFFGAPLGLLALAIAAELFIAAAIFAGLSLGSVITRLPMIVRPNSSSPSLYMQAVIGTVILLFIFAIPSVGFVVTFLFFLASLGAMVDVFLKRIWSER